MESLAFIMQTGIPAPQDLQMPKLEETVTKPKGSKRFRDDSVSEKRGLKRPHEDASPEPAAP